MLTKILLLCFALFSTSLGVSIRVRHRHQMGIDNVNEAIHQFSTNINKQLVQQGEGNENVVFSPFSIYVILALAHLGSNGQTQDELGDVMCIPKNKDWSNNVHDDLGQLIRQMKNDANANISMANGMFVQNGLNVKQDYVERMRQCYDNSLSNVDFNSNDATEIVNKWFEGQTRGRIQRFFEDRIPQETKLLLANAVCFGSNWNNNFPEEQTKLETFRNGNGEEQQVRMMQKTEDVQYYKDPQNQYEVVGIPYQRDDYHLYLILPCEGGNCEGGGSGTQDLRNLANILDHQHIKRIVNEARVTTCDIKLPKMKLRTNNNIRDILGQLGVNKLFDEPDLSNMLSDSNIKVSQVTHGFEMELNERRTDVCAGTAQQFTPKSRQHTLGDSARQFYVQKPFMFFVHHKDTNTVLFHGSINDASQGTDE